MKIKVCGMKYKENILSVSDLKPDYMGFIFYEKSPRHFEGKMPALDQQIIKTGVFVNEKRTAIDKKIKEYGLRAVQLHGDEPPEFCKNLKEFHQDTVEIIKAFAIGKDFDFKCLEPYVSSCDYFLFDTKGEQPGGNGVLFDWKLLEGYTWSKPYFLSGGIGLSEANVINTFLASPMSKYCYAIDVNSKFEMRPGMKNTEELNKFFELTGKEN